MNATGKSVISATLKSQPTTPDHITEVCKLYTYMQYNYTAMLP